MRHITYWVAFFLLNVWTVVGQTKNKALIVEILGNFEIMNKYGQAIDFCIQEAKKNSINELEDSFYQQLEEELKQYTQEALFDEYNHLINQQFRTGQLRKLSKDLVQNKETKRLEKFVVLMENEGTTISKKWMLGLLSLSSEKVNQANDSIVEKGLEACTQFREGKFKYKLPDDSEVMVVRKGNKQIETFAGYTATLSIQWMNACEYKIQIMDCSLQEMYESQKGVVTICKVQAIVGDTAIISARSEDQSLIYNIRLTKIE